MSEQTMTGYPSIDKPWLKYYSKEQITKEIPNCSLFEYVYDNNKNNLDDIAIEYYGRKITYKKMFEHIEDVSISFSNYRIENAVAACLLTVPETIYLVYGLDKIGITVDMIDPRNSVEWIKKFIKEDGANIIVTLDLLVPKILEVVGDGEFTIISISPNTSLPSIKKGISNITTKKHKVNDSRVIDWEEFIRNYKKEEKTTKDSNNNVERCSVIEHTGGTTGMPKSVMLSPYDFNAVATQCIYSPLAMERGDRLMNIMPPFIAYGMTLGIHVSLSAGWISVLIPKFDAEHFDDLLLKYKPQGVMGVPTYYESLMKSKKIKNKDLSFVKCLLVGGDKIKVEFEKQINKFLIEHNCNIEISKGYSMTEASSAATFSFSNCNKIGSCGIPLPKTIIAAFDDDWKELTYGEVGNIRINTPSMMMGYLNNEDETNNIIKTDSCDVKWICTGDLGYIDEDGNIFIEGRSKRLMVLRFFLLILRMRC